MATPSTPQAAALHKVSALKHHLSDLRTRHAEALRQIVDASLMRDQLVTEIAAAEAELEVAVQSPLEGGEDPTGWLPDELIIMIVLFVGWASGCGCVCRRWHALLQSPVLKSDSRLWNTRWVGYASGRIKPKVLSSNFGIESIAVSRHGKLYWSSSIGASTCMNVDGSQRALESDMRVTTMAVGLDGTVYSASYTSNICVHSGKDESYMGVLAAHLRHVTALDVNLKDNILYSGDSGGAIHAWSCETRKLIDTFERQPHCVSALVVGMGDRIISACDRSVLMWRGGQRTGEGLGHTADVTSLATSRAGLVVSGSRDGTVRVWSGQDLGAIRIIQARHNHVNTVAVDELGSVFWGSENGDVIACVAPHGRRIPIYHHIDGATRALAWAPDGTLYAGFSSSGSHPRLCAFGREESATMVSACNTAP